MLTEAVKGPDTAITAQYYLRSIAREEGRLDEAVQELQQALKADPNYADALAELGGCYLMKKEYEQAGKLLRRALVINPNHYAANFNLLTLYTRAKKDGREAAQVARFEEVKKLREVGRESSSGRTLPIFLKILFGLEHSFLGLLHFLTRL
ncbi:MAG: tetratricopeptide repeat protein [Chloracidobacterium sp.]|nr:tetratricopeptide repeat protein [Chloracidobacterium sp.]